VADAVGALQGIILTLRDRHEEAEPLLQAAVDGLLRHHRGIAATTLCFQAGGLVRRGEVAEARQLAERAVDVAEPLGDYLRVGGARSILALVLCVGGDVEAGLRVMEPVLRLVEGAESDVFVPGLATTMGTLHLWRDEAARAAAWFERDAGSTDRGAETYLAAQALPGLAAALTAADRPDEAERVVERALAVARRLGMPSVLADALEQQARLAVASDAGRAVDLHHEALAVRVEHGLRAPAADSLDALVALAEPAPEAVRVLAACDEARRTMGCQRPPAARCAYEATLARLRSALGEGAFAKAWAAGAGLTLDEAIAYVRRGRGARRRPAFGWDSLTPAELDVVRLVVAGLDNPGIGSRLFMSRGTVKSHLSHVFAKLGVANRTELATLAAGRAEVVVPGSRRRGAAPRSS
jgi:DNA-binding NarL/FixJ family response regulator